MSDLSRKVLNRLAADLSQAGFQYEFLMVVRMARQRATADVELGIVRMRLSRIAERWGASRRGRLARVFVDRIDEAAAIVRAELGRP